MSQALQFLRAAQIHRSANFDGRVPVSKSLWFRWVQQGFAPQPVKVGRVSMWRAAAIDAFLARISAT